MYLIDEILAILLRVLEFDGLFESGWDGCLFHFYLLRWEHMTSEVVGCEL